MVGSVSTFDEGPDGPDALYPESDNQASVPAAPAPAPKKSAASAPSATPKKSRAAGESDRRKRALIKSALDKHASIESTDATTRSAMAALLGCKDDASEITAYALTAKPDTGAVASLAGLRDGEELSAVIEAAMIAENKKTLSKIWSLIEVVEPTGKEAPVKEGVTQAAVTLVRRVRGLDASAIDVFDSAADALS